MRLLPLLALVLVGCAGSSVDEPDALPTGGTGSSTSEMREQPSEEPLGTDVRPPSPPPTGRGSSTSTPTSPSAPLKADLYAVTIDGVAMTFDGASLWAPNPVNANEYDLFIKFHGSGAPSGSDVAISATRTGAGCKSGENFLTFRPSGDTTQFMPAQTASCGFSVTELPTVGGKRLTGTFKGTLTSINESPARTRSVEITFDVARPLPPT